jgi:predicted DCC family thiol-disulfide oxidoreductase YuxK
MWKSLAGLVMNARGRDDSLATEAWSSNNRFHTSFIVNQDIHAQHAADRKYPGCSAVHIPGSRVKKKMDKDTLYYDGACPLCSAEIDKLCKLAGDGLVVRDIHKLGEGEDLPDKKRLLSRLHLQTADGQWITGLRANIRAWDHTPLRRLWRLLDWPLISPVSHWCYESWLRRRISR